MNSEYVDCSSAVQEQKSPLPPIAHLHIITEDDEGTPYPWRQEKLAQLVARNAPSRIV